MADVLLGRRDPVEAALGYTSFNAPVDTRMFVPLQESDNVALVDGTATHVGYYADAKGSRTANNVRACVYDAVTGALLATGEQLIVWGELNLIALDTPVAVTQGKRYSLGFQFDGTANVGKDNTQVAYWSAAKPAPYADGAPDPLPAEDDGSHNYLGVPLVWLEGDASGEPPIDPEPPTGLHLAGKLETRNGAAHANQTFSVHVMSNPGEARINTTTQITTDSSGNWTLEDAALVSGSSPWVNILNADGSITFAGFVAVEG